MWPLKYRVRWSSQKNRGGNDKNVGEAKEIGLLKKGMTDAADTPVGRANDKHEADYSGYTSTSGRRNKGVKNRPSQGWGES